jgi:hypothetical protein
LGGDVSTRAFVVVETLTRRHLGLARSVEAAQAIAEDNDEATGYFTDRMNWTQTIEDTGSLRWTGEIVTGPNGERFSATIFITVLAD